MRRAIATAALVVGLVLTAGPTTSAERKPPKDVKINELTSETQLTIEPTSGMNLTWYVPLEFWEIALAKNDGVTPAAAKEMTEALHPYFFVMCARADISAMGSFRFHNREKVAKDLTITYVAADGTEVAPKRVTEISDDAKTVLTVMRPILANAMGKLGQNMHFFVYANRDDAGKAIVDPTRRGTLKISLAKTLTEAGGDGEIAFPLNCLFVPRMHCDKPMHVSWNFCPHCGKKLEPVLEGDKSGAAKSAPRAAGGTKP